MAAFLTRLAHALLVTPIYHLKPAFVMRWNAMVRRQRLSLQRCMAISGLQPAVVR